MTKKIVLINFLIAIMTSCNAQTRLDITSMSFETPSIQVEEVPKWDDGSYITSPVRTYCNVEAFSFGDFKPTNGGEAAEVDFSPYFSRINFYFDKQKEHIIAAEITVKKNEESSAFFDYLTKKYGQPITLENTIRKDKDYAVLMGYAAYLWKNVADNRSIIASQGYSREQGKSVYSLDVYYVKTNDPEIVSTHYDIGVNAYERLILQNSSDARSEITKDIEKFKARYY